MLLRDYFYIFLFLSNSRLFLNMTLYFLNLGKYAVTILSRIPVTDIARPRRVNAMKVFLT